MPNFNGTCSSKVQSQTTMEVPGPMNRQVGVAMMLGKHKCAVPQWNDAMMTYVGTTDSVDGNGQQRGYFHNVHTNGRYQLRNLRSEGLHDGRADR